MSFSSFVRNVSQVLEKGLFSKSNASKLGQKLDKVLFVTGNESADLDSCASSILNAYYYTIAIDSGKAPKLPWAFNPYIVIPLINIPREDLKLRPDITFMLDTVGYSTHALAFLDDFSNTSSDSNFSPIDASVFLVDHNKLTGLTKQLFKSDKVVGVLDHHVDENVYPFANPRIIKNAGSCMSVVTNYWASQLKESLEFSSKADKDSVNIAALGLSPIISDTSGLKSKVEQDDTQAYEFYSKIISQYKPNDIKENDTKSIKYDVPNSASLFVTPMLNSPSSNTDQANKAQLFSETFTNPDKFIDMLSSKKQDISQLRGSDLLRKDYKEWSRDEEDLKQQDLKIGISSVPVSLTAIYRKYPSSNLFANPPRLAFTRDIRDRAKSRGIDVYLVMTTYHNSQNVFSRDLFLCATSDRVSHDDMKTLVEKMATAFDLKDPQDTTQKAYDERSSSFQFWQGDVSASRKQIAPLVRHVVQGVPLTKI